MVETKSSTIKDTNTMMHNPLHEYVVTVMYNCTNTSILDRTAVGTSCFDHFLHDASLHNNSFGRIFALVSRMFVNATMHVHMLALLHHPSRLSKIASTYSVAKDTHCEWLFEPRASMNGTVQTTICRVSFFPPYACIQIMHMGEWNTSYLYVNHGLMDKMKIAIFSVIFCDSDSFVGSNWKVLLLYHTKSIRI